MPKGLSITLRQSAPIPLAVELVVASGETLALVGASGAGKSTTLRAIAGLYQAPQGRIVCNGEIWFDHQQGINVPGRRRRVGVVFQSYALFPHKTALSNVSEAMLDQPRRAREAIALELLDRVHLGDFADRLPRELSGGQQQRVALARALARDPHVLLLDEPFSAVDHPTRRAMHSLLAEIRRSTKMPIIIVSHDVEDASRGADQICYMRDGVTVEQGPTRVLLDTPHTHLSRWLKSEL
ncbi:ATP-binding cassette domain-containing protein [Novosphingobium sp. RD2P27]|uniref:ATP-binding cassette domain-containing protein n=1 Tax=Novosphingobium kalidii TaxID=3230299 RepID=A0ABV2CYC0_9SPHN